MINIKNRQDIISKLNTLNEHSIPAFGKMTVQHMIEHLLETIGYSINKPAQKLCYTEEKANIIKSIVIHSDKEMPEGFRSPIIGDTLPALKFDSIQTAIKMLEKELAEFEHFFKENKNIKPMNPVVGPLDESEWMIFHNKHFSHHFRQFRLL